LQIGSRRRNTNRHPAEHRYAKNGNVVTEQGVGFVTFVTSRAMFDLGASDLWLASDCEGFPDRVYDEGRIVFI
jgi:hypothetical protein